jgi:hypothetical protein
MDYISLFTSQLTDIFRIGLLAGLVYTAIRNQAQTGLVLPFVAGIVFVAVIIPSTMPKPGVELLHAVLSGLVSNAVIVAVLWLLWSRFKPRT